MTFKLDTEIQLSPDSDKTYYISSAHRNDVTKDKSRWIISMGEEVECFIESQEEEWIESNLSWGIRSNGNGLECIGFSTQDDELKFAKFIDSSKNNKWHGYPADYIRRQQDRPGIPVLKIWREKNIILKHHIIKIRQGKACNL
ncbi:hypothetical protein IC229_04220 [Spirosoma sp. BT702]|uniref:Uncharacterized protein n=1 Tax=Spirosoma profusum TaxID=2771354 RepID=A0A926XXX1_9BACT|nr:hypothetical protein [Spirosoma profusum]MBD2699828.1 hypothetical protein [Spirosoma profusum]